MTKLWALWHKAVLWFHKEFQESAENLMRDMRSMRALWNYLFLALYTWVVVWLVLKAPTTSGNTAIITTGGIVTAIFTNYVWSKVSEKKAEVEAKKMEKKAPESEHGASD